MKKVFLTSGPVIFHPWTRVNGVMDRGRAVFLLRGIFELKKSCFQNSLLIFHESSVT